MNFLAGWESCWRRQSSGGNLEKQGAGTARSSTGPPSPAAGKRCFWICCRGRRRTVPHDCRRFHHPGIVHAQATASCADRDAVLSGVAEMMLRAVLWRNRWRSWRVWEWQTQSGRCSRFIEAAHRSATSRFRHDGRVSFPFLADGVCQLREHFFSPDCCLKSGACMVRIPCR